MTGFFPLEIAIQPIFGTEKDGCFLFDSFGRERGGEMFLVFEPESADRFFLCGDYDDTEGRIIAAEINRDGLCGRPVSRRFFFHGFFLLMRLFFGQVVFGCSGKIFLETFRIGHCFFSRTDTFSSIGGRVFGGGGSCLACLKGLQT